MGKKFICVDNVDLLRKLRLSHLRLVKPASTIWVDALTARIAYFKSKTGY